ncbi:MAG TPA: VWA domain-containing protein [Candidatus Limnocylindrales bacterium]|nr:VWA domain-containing protein [Candidatus Limnocylindrales bacterium]
MIRPAAFLLAVNLALAQAPLPNAYQTQQPETVIRINVNVVQMDAVVTDAKGNHITDLSADDFQILQDGKPQRITNFSYIDTAPTAAAASSTPAPAAVKKGTPPPPPVVLKPSQVRRTVAVVIDDLALSFDSVARIRSSLKKFVNTEVQPGDMVAILRTSAGMGAFQQFTTDKRILNAAIDRIKFNGLGRVGVSSFAPLGSGENSALERERNSIIASGSLGAIRYVVDGLRDLPGRKSLMLFTENLQLFHRNDPDPRVMDNLNRLLDAADRSSVVIYSIDPRGLQYYGLTAADNTRGMNSRQIANLPMRRSAEVFRSQDGMVRLASQTGGLFLHDNNDIFSEIRQVMEDSQGYYLLAYHPDASTFDPRTGQARFHKLEVKVKREGLKVRYRSGFLGNSDRYERQVAQTPAALLAHALNSPFSSGQIHVQLTGLFSYDPKRGPYLSTLLHIDARDLKFEDVADGHHKATIDLLAVTFDENGIANDTTSQTHTIDMPDETYRTALKNGLLYDVPHPVKKPGPYQMRVAICDPSTDQVGSATQFVEVPDVNKGKLTVSSLIMREDQKGSADNPDGSPAVRHFRPGHELIYAFQILNAQSDAGKQPEVEIQTRMFRDGQQIYQGKPMALDLHDQADPKHLLGGGAMQLGPTMKPGDYVLQVIVTDKGSRQTAAQSMDFQVVG